MASFPFLRVHRQRRHERRRSNPGDGRFIRYGLPAAVLVLAVTVLPVWLFFSTLVAAWAYFGEEMPAPETIETRSSPGSILLYDRNGQFLYEIFDPNYGRRQHIPLGEIAPAVVQATIATEDRDFYLNSGIDLRGILRAFYNNVSNQEDDSVQGGSSITQQLVKNVLIPEDERTARSFSRKIKEVLLAYDLTRRYTKEQILEWYLNEVYYGNMSYGIEAAAQSYFGKSARDLSLAEASMLAGLPQAPARYSPLTNPAEAKTRQRDVLDIMVRQGRITQDEADAAETAELEYQAARFPINAPHFVMYVRSLLERKYGARGLYRQSLKVTTTLDLDFDRQVQDLLKKRMQINRRYGASNGAVIVLEPKTGEILAMAGSADYYDAKIKGQVNMTTAPRQPGSSFKPYVYLSAFLKGWNPSTIVQDRAITIGSWSPHNYNGSTSGPMEVRRALGNSLNIPAVRAIMHAGVEFTIAMTHRMGITTLTEPPAFYGPPVSLGAGDIPLLDHAFGFSVFANTGKMIGQELPPDLRRPGFRELEPAAILKIEDSAGNVLEEYTPSEREIVEPQYAYMVTHILSDNGNRVQIFGPSSALHIPEFPAAVKTGTSEHNRDNLAMGYTPQLVVGVWMGNNDGRPMSGSADGVTTAAPLWREVMRLYHKGKPVMQFERPPGPIPGIDDRRASVNERSRPGRQSAREEDAEPTERPQRQRRPSRRTPTTPERSSTVQPDADSTVEDTPSNTPTRPSLRDRRRRASQD